MSGINVMIRDVTTDGTKKVTVPGVATVGELKSAVVPLLQTWWQQKQHTTPDFALTEQNIVVFTDSTNTPRASELADVTPLDPNVLYHASEKFTIAPCHLSRTVSPSQGELSLLVYTNFGVTAGATKDYTIMSPAMCAAMTEDAYLSPGPSIGHNPKSGNTELLVDGIPLFCEMDGSPSQNPVHPYAPIGKNERPGSTLLTANQLDAMGGHDRNPVSGILQTKLTHSDSRSGERIDPRPAPTVPKSERKTRAQNKDANGDPDPLAVMRRGYFWYQMEAGTDLAPYGMELWFDNHVKNHVTLRHVREPVRQEKWAQLGHLFQQLYVPAAQVANIDVLAPPLETERTNMMTASVDPDDEPVRLFHGAIRSASSDRFIVFPKVAGLFRFRGFKIRAMAEPAELESSSDDGDTTKTMVLYRAAIDLFYADSTGEEVMSAIRDLEAAQYAAAGINHRCHATLLGAMKARVTMLQEMEDEAMEDAAGEISPNQNTIDVLENGISLLEYEA